MSSRALCVLTLFCVNAATSHAAVFGTVRGIVHDPQHRPISGASALLSSETSDWTRSAITNSEGEFQIPAVPIGRYSISVSSAGFTSLCQKIEVQSGSAPILHFPLRLAPLDQQVEVSAAPEWINPDSPSTTNIVSREDVAKSPGADRTNSLAMITNFTPGAYVVHDQLHIRGGHQVTWLVDGVPVPNTNIANNVGPQFDPHDVDYLETQRGGYSADYGDRMFGVFNLVPRSGFERNNDAELTLGYGSFHETNDHFSFGGHTPRFAYYASISGNRTDLGLEPVAAQVLHDLSGSVGGFASMIYNPDAANQLRVVGSIRGDHYQVPNTPELQSQGTRDVQHENDAFLNLSWVRNLGSGAMLTVSPYFHRNHTVFEGGPNDAPVIATDEHISDYLGGEVSLSLLNKKHNLRGGISGLGQQERSLLGLRPADGTASNLEQSLAIWGNTEAVFLEDQYKITGWLTLNGGARLTHFAGQVSENAASPRAGAALRIPGLKWILRGYYGRFYQPPPLSTISGPILDLALAQGFAFMPLRGERDEQREAGLAIPLGGWGADLSYFRTNSRNFFDHTPLGNSNVFFPLTIDQARIRGFEAMVRSPRLFRHLDLHTVYSHQYVEGRGGISGGLTDFNPPENGFYFLDHDQRNTFSSGFEVDLPRRTWVSGNVGIGSGFLDGDGPGHLQAHTTVDFSIGKSLGERLSVRLTALNITNGRYQLDNSNTFGGTHYNLPRQILISLRYGFHY